jgi:phospholipase C
MNGTRARRALASMMVVAVASTIASAVVPRSALATGNGSPIRHVVIFFQENHSFDNVLGWFCATTTRQNPCDGASTGLLSNGTRIPLSQPPDVVPSGCYLPVHQQRGIDGGKMDGFGDVCNCKLSSRPCYSAYRPSQIPNLSGLASTFAISDRTFELSPVPSWSGHSELVAPTLDGFTGDLPFYNAGQSPPPPPQGRGWGCDSNRDALWTAPASTAPTPEPACIPDPSLDPVKYPFGGAYRATPVPHVDTIMDRLDAGGLSWKVYSNNYIWSICPTFADCLYTPQKARVVSPSRFVSDAQTGNLPNFSVLLPSGGVSGSTSQHNGTSMALGDNWIAQAVSAVEKGPDWSSTAIFITYDDNGGFYDHVPPPFAGAGIRVPMVIVSPYARPGYTDSTAATFASMLAFTEHTFGLASLSAFDSSAYDFSNAFNYLQAPLPGVALSPHPISGQEQTYLAAHPPNPNDPT